MSKRPVDVVTHLAADVGGLSYNMAHSASIYERNMRMAMNVLDAARRSEVSRVLLCSSACLYPRFCTVPTPEEGGFDGEPEPTNAGYGWSKRMMEFLGKQFHEEFDSSQPSGQPRRNCSTVKAREKIGYEAKVSLSDGLSQTID